MKKSILKRTSEKLKEISDGLQEAHIFSIRESLNERIVNYARSENGNLLAVSVKIFDTSKLMVFNLSLEQTVQEEELHKEVRTLTFKGNHLFLGHSMGIDVYEIGKSHPLFTIFEKKAIANVIFHKSLFVTVEKPVGDDWKIYKSEDSMKTIDHFRLAKFIRKTDIDQGVIKVEADPDGRFLVMGYPNAIVSVNMNMTKSKLDLGSITLHSISFSSSTF